VDKASYVEVVVCGKKTLVFLLNCQTYVFDDLPGKTKSVEKITVGERFQCGESISTISTDLPCCLMFSELSCQMRAQAAIWCVWQLGLAWTAVFGARTTLS